MSKSCDTLNQAKSSKMNLKFLKLISFILNPIYETPTINTSLFKEIIQMSKFQMQSNIYVTTSETFEEGQILIGFNLIVNFFVIETYQIQKKILY